MVSRRLMYIQYLCSGPDIRVQEASISSRQNQMVCDANCAINY